MEEGSQNCRELDKTRGTLQKKACPLVQKSLYATSGASRLTVSDGEREERERDGEEKKYTKILCFLLEPFYVFCLSLAVSPGLYGTSRLDNRVCRTLCQMKMLEEGVLTQNLLEL